MVKLPPNPRLDVHTATPLQIAQQLDSWGLQVLPARFRDKAPVVDWKKHQVTRTTRMLGSWFKSNRLNFWVMCGQISKVVVIDADSATGDAWWRDQLGDEIMDATARVKTRKGHHYWFTIPADYTEPIKSWSHHVDDLSFDVRADRTGIIVPPSVHESGLIYTWEVPFSEALPAPAALLDGSLHALLGDTAVTPGGAGGAPAGGGTRSLLARLLASPPGRGGRNDWLTKVAGHHAKQYREQHDAYLQMCADANAKLTPPLDQGEFDKTVNSIWDSEHANNEQRSLDADCGWLKGNGKTLFTQVQRSQGDERVYELAEWGNFDVTAKGVTREPDQSKVFWVGLHTRDGDLDILLRGTVLGDDRKLRAWLAGFGCTCWPPANMFPKDGSPGVRLQRYLESQNPPTIEVTSSLGWNQDVLDGQGAFVTHGGIILASGPVSADKSGVRADPILLSSSIAPHQYGFERDANEASRVLAEVLSFHDEQVTSVFGAWWAACLLKPQLQSRSALFPFVGVEAPSESGKTNGFFDMMVQLNGSVRGEVVPTRAVLRNMIAAHNNGIVWVDDLDDPAYLMELLRAATSGGTIAKMGEDRTSAVESKLVAPVVISGEQLGLGSQKALLDRAIMLHVGSPVGRKSRHDPSRPQWDDILALREEYQGGLHVLSGWYVMKALSVESQVAVALAEGRTGQGRAGDKVAVLRAGARLLDHLVGHDGAWEGRGVNAGRVEDWLAGQVSSTLGQHDNSLTLELVPWALRKWNFPDRPMLGEHGRSHTPVWVEGWTARNTIDTEMKVWINADLLAEAWSAEHHGRIEQRTQSAAALRMQLDAIPDTRSKQVRLQGATGHDTPRMRYRALTGSMARNVITRAQGKD